MDTEDEVVLISTLLFQIEMSSVGIAIQFPLQFNACSINKSAGVGMC